MRRKTLRPLVCAVLSALGALSLISCGENNPPPGNGASASADNHLVSDAGSVAMAPAASAAPAAPASPAAAAAQPASLRGRGIAGGTISDAPTPPRDAQWTLLAYTERSPTHVQDVNQLKDDLIRKTGRNKWYAIHGRDESNLYYGFYRSTDDPKDSSSAAAQADKQFVRNLELKDTWGQVMKPFKDAGFFPLSAPDPAAPPEWNLFNKDLAKRPKDPTRAFWSLQIMAFKANPLRKEAAVQVVAALRKQGVEAYYYHADEISSVCVGSWPLDAVEQQTHDGDHTVAGPDETLYVYPTALPQGAKPREYDDQGHRIVAIAPVLRIKDKSMKVMIAKYPFHAVNYEIHGVKGSDGIFHEDPSFLVVIPRAKGNGFYDSSDLSPSDLAAGEVGGERTTFFGTPSPGSASGGGASGGSGAAGTYGARLPQAPAGGETPGVGHLRRLGE